MDAPADAAPDHTCFGTLAFDRVCFANTDLPSASVTFTGTATIDSDRSSRCSTTAEITSGDPACVIVATAFTLSGGSTLHLIGSKPVIFVATTTSGTGINLNSSSVLDASTYGTGAGAQVGAAALATACSLGAVGAEPVAKGGGYGGSFVALGGAGGKETGNNASVGGLPPPSIGMPIKLHGGCPGGIGEGNDKPRAFGGGALALVANVIVIDGLVAAGGSGGQTSGGTFKGGNGGAAGGLIVLDAKTTLKGNGAIEARGGGGGQGVGGNANQGSDGFAGYDPLNPASDGAGGGSSSTTGGYGGDGAPNATDMKIGDVGLPGTSTAAGGGGGGASGVILTPVVQTGALTYKPSPN